MDNGRHDVDNGRHDVDNGRHDVDNGQHGVEMPNGGSIPGETALNARARSFTASVVTTQ